MAGRRHDFRLHLFCLLQAQRTLRSQSRRFGRPSTAALGQIRALAKKLIHLQQQTQNYQAAPPGGRLETHVRAKCRTQNALLDQVSQDRLLLLIRNIYFASAGSLRFPYY